MMVYQSIRKFPQNWHNTKYCLVHISGIRLWTASGLFFCAPENSSYSLIDKWRCWRAYRWWCKNKPVEEVV